MRHIIDDIHNRGVIPQASITALMTASRAHYRYYHSIEVGGAVVLPTGGIVDHNYYKRVNIGMCLPIQADVGIAQANLGKPHIFSSSFADSKDTPEYLLIDSLTSTMSDMIYDNTIFTMSLNNILKTEKYDILDVFNSISKCRKDNIDFKKIGDGNEQ